MTQKNEDTRFARVAAVPATGARRLPAFVCGLSLLWPLAGSCGDEYPVAGVEPDKRPANAPVLTTAVKGKRWYRHALTGVEPPYPASLRFLEDQGNWFTPFSYPGMTGRYDIRHWHR